MYTISELTLSGFKRLKLSNIHTITITPESLYQIILGTNGSGKSSLIDEMSPLPAKANDYIKGGFKLIKIEYNGSSYVLRSDFQDKQTHSFLKDGVELNSGRTVTVQKELAEREFGITKETHLLMTGKLRFTQMSPNKRREIITSISDTDLTYAIGVYKKVSTTARDVQGAIKQLKVRIGNESEKFVANDIDDGIYAYVEQLTEELTVLYENRAPNLPATSELGDRLERTFSRAMSISNEIMSIEMQQQNTYHPSLISVQNELNRAAAKVSAKQDLLKHYVEEHDRLESLIGSLTETGVADIDELRDKEQEYTNEINTLSKRIKCFEFTGDVSVLFSDSQTIKASLVEVLAELKDNSDKRYSRTRLDEIESQMMDIKSEIERARSKANKLRSDIEHISGAKHTKCPKCEHIWREGITEEDVEQMRESAVRYEDHAEKKQKELTELSAEKDEIKEYGVQYGRFRTLSHSYPAAKNLFDWLVEEDRIFHNPSQHIPVIDLWISDLELASKIWDLNLELDVIKTAMSNASVLNTSSNKHVSVQTEEIEKSIDSITHELSDLRDSIEYLKLIEKKGRRLEELGDELESLIEQLSNDEKSYIDSLRSETINKLIAQHQTQLAINSNKIQEREGLQNVIEDMKKHLEQMETSYTQFKLLAQTLSPVDGLIAEQMTMFIRCLTDQVNDIIENIYTYPMRVLPCGIESNELDYKFPLLVGDDDEPSTDVADGSMGQVDIIDFAFKLVITMYMGFIDCPLFADEVGSHQDEQHHINLMNYLKTLIEAQRYSQLFMISHFAVGSGSFVNADVLVLNPANIAVPEGCNKHVIIE